MPFRLSKTEKPRYHGWYRVSRERVLERREVEKRIYGVKGFAAHGFRVLSVCILAAAFEQPITELKTKIDKFVNRQSLKTTFADLGRRFHNA